MAARPRGGSLRVKPLVRHVAEVDDLCLADLGVLIDRSRATVTTLLHHARAEVELNVSRATAPSPLLE